MGQRQLCLLIDHQGQAHLPQIVAALLIMSALRQFGTQIGAGNVGIKVGCIVSQSLQVQLLHGNHIAHQLLFDSR